MTGIVKKSKVREAAGEMNVGGDFYTEIDEKVRELIEDAVERAEANDRKTVKARDA